MTINTTPAVDFNPQDPTHRMAVARFMKRYAWNDAGIRFTHDPEYGNLVDQVKDKLLKFYLAQEATS